MLRLTLVGILLVPSTAYGQNLPVKNSRLSAQDRELCSTIEGRQTLADRSTPEELARLERAKDLWEKHRIEALNSRTRAIYQQLGRPWTDPVPFDIDAARRTAVDSYCEVQGSTAINPFVISPFMIDLFRRNDRDAEKILETTFRFRNLRVIRCDGDQERCDTEEIFPLPSGYQVCTVTARPSRHEASWRTGRLRYWTEIARVNPDDGAAPRAVAVKVVTRGYTTSNYPIRVYMDLDIRAIAIEFTGDERFKRSCGMYREGQMIQESDSPAPGREMQNVNR